jgi:hypothetical protein
MSTTERVLLVVFPLLAVGCIVVRFLGYGAVVPGTL